MRRLSPHLEAYGPDDPIPDNRGESRKGWFRLLAALAGVSVLTILACAFAAFVIAFIVAVSIPLLQTVFVKAIALGAITVCAIALLMIVDGVRYRIAVRNLHLFLETLPVLTFQDFSGLYPEYKNDFLQQFREATANYFGIEQDKVGPALHFGPSSPLYFFAALFYCALFERFCPEALRGLTMAYPKANVETLEDLIRETEELTRREVESTEE